MSRIASPLSLAGALQLFAALGCMVVLAAPVLADGGVKRDAGIEPTHRGEVLGQVYDIQTGLPIEGARIVIQEDGVFPDAGRRSNQTDLTGRYQASAAIGRVSQNLDIGRLLNTGLFGLIAGGATNKTKRIDVSRLTVRITADGYQPFEGVVACRKVEPEEFAVTLEPVMLAKSGAEGVSFAASRWGALMIKSVRMEPSIVRPRQEALLQVKIDTPPVESRKDLRGAYYYESGDFITTKLFKAQEDKAADKLYFEAKLNGTKQNRAQVAEVTFDLYESPYDVKGGGRAAPVLLQTVTNDSEQETAVQREKAFNLSRAGEATDAAKSFQRICDGPNALAWDFEQLALLSEKTHDNTTALAAWKGLAERTTEKERGKAEAHVAAAMVAGGQAAGVIQTWAPRLAEVKEKDRVKKFEAPLVVALGEAYMQTGDLSAAESIDRLLMDQKDEKVAPLAGAFHGKLRLVTTRAAATASPVDPAARAAYGRVLLDNGQWEEAATELATAVKLDPSLPAVRRDLTYALLHARGDAAVAPRDLDAAIEAATQEARIVAKDGKVEKSKDFFAWHALGILLYTKAMTQSAAGDEAAADTMRQSREAFQDALRVARTGAKVDQGDYDFFFGYTSPRVRAIAGFAYKEADSDFVILDSLETLEQHPDNYLAHFALASALVDLQQPKPALEQAARTLDLKPGYVEAKYVQALARLQLGDTAAAKGLLQAVLKSNPQHPNANLTLARVYTEQGDMGAAATCMAAHARLYGG